MRGITRREFVKGAALGPLALSPFSSVAQRASTSDLLRRAGGMQWQE
jgi:hypothetical protein